MASVAVEDENGIVFAGNPDRLAGVGALVEKVDARFLIVDGNPFADGLLRRLDGKEKGGPRGNRVRQ